jgi:hypothetical protein
MVKRTRLNVMCLCVLIILLLIWNFNFLRPSRCLSHKTHLCSFLLTVRPITLFTTPLCSTVLLFTSVVWSPKQTNSHKYDVLFVWVLVITFDVSHSGLVCGMLRCVDRKIVNTAWNVACQLFPDCSNINNKALWHFETLVTVYCLPVYKDTSGNGSQF